MKKLMICLTMLLLLTGFSWSDENRLNVVTTTTDLKSIAEMIGGEYVSVTNICQGNQDPHFIQAKPVYMVRARNADLWIRIGLELEIGYEEPIIEGSRNTRIQIGDPGHLDASEGVLLLEVPTTQKIDRSMGDVHPLGNPHYWLDPYNGRVMAKNITDRLKKLAPANKDIFEKNYQAFIRKLDEAMFGKELVAEIGGERLWGLELTDKLDGFIKAHNQKLTTNNRQLLKLGGWVGKMRPHQGKKIITYHRSWSYFVNRFNLVVAEELEPKPGIPPSPRHLVEVIKKIKAEKMKILIMENYYSRKAPEFVSKKTGITIVQVANAVGGEKEAVDYISMIDNIAEKIDAALK